MASVVCSRACPFVSHSSTTFSGRSLARTGRVALGRVQAVKAPAGVTMPPRQPDVPPPKNGFVDYAERLNSRAAMIGFFALLAVEGFFGKGLLDIIGVATGNGLGFEL
ncbi:hypothetical protein VOLCADRAFT_75186 [Volvox carteri f. nagariensis]|uniref:High light inducible protein n=1 Tax=Volvox carteri f. nagariensis TaxID=3068 RepID=D8TZQ5_VOLCA|nr:uncharacterized protein VOLCADRAFT_75186 [Volvox carteri f. nagariensis]EFJ46964.1 hypothetical protein VOLCADRAFT_75186 [Volvox carteri f. nagariensis]|eukprot:XP_002951859.1 hypothetical protein VOLCADRAFT_75186 [Volvox carteri f. nagariensis]